MKQTGSIVGFCGMGDMNNELENFENRIENKKEDKSMSTYVLTFMVRGVFTSLAYPFAYFADQGFSSDLLYPCVWQSVRVLEAINLKVLFFNSDGASPNRRFCRLNMMHDQENTPDDSVIYWRWNRSTTTGERRKIYFICDVPHLIKTIRNNIENSHGHKNTRNLVVNGFCFYDLSLRG